jgi:hypothetical protein
MLKPSMDGGESHRFRPLIDLYREAGRQTGYSADQLKVGVHSLGYIAENTSTWRHLQDHFYDEPRLITSRKAYASYQINRYACRPRTT